jgi:hypothetical protein
MRRATFLDVAKRLGRAVPSDPLVIDQWSMWLQDAKTLIQARVTDIAERCALDETLGDVVVSIEAKAVCRKELNPEGLYQTTMTVDDGSITKIKDRTGSSGEVTFLDEEWALIIPRNWNDAWSTRPTFEPDSVG